MSVDFLQRILTARVYDVAVETPLTCAQNLSARLGDEIWLKREDLQPVFSFKDSRRLQQDGASARPSAAARRDHHYGPGS